MGHGTTHLDNSACLNAKTSQPPSESFDAKPAWFVVHASPPIKSPGGNPRYGTPEVVLNYMGNAGTFVIDIHFDEHTACQPTMSRMRIHVPETNETVILKNVKVHNTYNMSFEIAWSTQQGASTWRQKTFVTKGFVMPFNAIMDVFLYIDVTTDIKLDRYQCHANWKTKQETEPTCTHHDKYGAGASGIFFGGFGLYRHNPATVQNAQYR